MRSTIVAVAVLAVGSAGCTTGSGALAPPGPKLSKPALALKVMHHVSPFFYCDPDTTPIQAGDLHQLAEAGVRAVRRHHPTSLAAVVSDLGLPRRRSYGPAAVDAIWNRYKRMRAIESTFVANTEGYQYSYLPADPKGGFDGAPVVGYTGEIRTDGLIIGESPTPVQNFGGCPICLLRGTAIDTPRGPIAIDRLHAGDLVWTSDIDGHRIPATVLDVRSLAVGPLHLVVRVALADGRALVASPGHPLVDGREVADLTRHDRYDGSRVVAVHHYYVRHARTFDLLPSGPTGFYWANGVEVASTLHAPVS